VSAVFYAIDRVYVMKFEVPQTSLHKQLTITQNTADTPQASLHNYGTIKQITADISQASLHKHGTIT
jgi:hypothetical protein